MTAPKDEIDVGASATVAQWENGVQGDTRTMPAKYLHHITPSDLGSTVVIFMGPLAGKRGVVRGDDGDVILVQTLEDQVLEDVRKDYTALCVADPF